MALVGRFSFIGLLGTPVKLSSTFPLSHKILLAKIRNFISSVFAEILDARCKISLFSS